VMATPLAATAIVLAVLIGIGHVGWAPWWILVAGLLLARCRVLGGRRRAECRRHQPECHRRYSRQWY